MGFDFSDGCDIKWINGERHIPFVSIAGLLIWISTSETVSITDSKHLPEIKSIFRVVIPGMRMACIVMFDSNIFRRINWSYVKI
ncbi:hypothetical protein AAA088_10285 [Hominifimenecus microfluidus]|uniref:hypothetical protein n=1 Tax=Hominifimenecus microfluidus TaxID=2885348 RepID=UPI0032C1195D